MLASCEPKNVTNIENVKVTVLSTEKNPKGFFNEYQSRVITNDSTVYVFFSACNYQKGDKIYIKLKNKQIVY